MIVNISKLLPPAAVPARLPPEQIKKYQAHFADVLAKYGFSRLAGYDNIIHQLTAFMAVKYAHEKSNSRSPRKGLLLIGEIGTGKSLSLRILSGLFRIEYLTATQIISLYAADDKRFWDNVHDQLGRRRELIIDDLGTERDVKIYGNDSIMPEFLAWRYECFQDGALTHLATNLNADILVSRYGERIVSRLREMCRVVSFTGEDLRK